MDVGADPTNPTLLGVLKDSTNMDNARSVALDVNAGLAYVAAENLDNLAIVDVGTDPTNPTLLGVLKDSTNMDGAYSVALDVDAGLAYVAATNSDSLAIVDVGTDPTNPTLLGVLKDSTNMDGAYRVALDVDAGLAYVAAYISNSLAIVDVGTAISWCAQDFSIASNRHNITTWLSSYNYAMLHFTDQFSTLFSPWRCSRRSHLLTHGTTNTVNAHKASIVVELWAVILYIVKAISMCHTQQRFSRKCTSHCGRAPRS